MPIIIKNGKVYGDRSVTLSQAEYNALSEVEKNNGTTYYIYDVNGVVTADDVALDGGTVETLAGSVATIETSPATANHEVGEYILWNGVVYVVTSAIATGESLVINSNISARTVGEELTALNNGLTDMGRPINVSGWCQAFYVAAWGLVVQIPMDTRKYAVNVGSGCQVYTPTVGWVDLPTTVTKNYGGSFVNIVFPATVLSGEYDGRVVLVNMAGLSVSER